MFIKELNIIFIIIILLLTAANSNELSNSFQNKNTAYKKYDEPNLGLIEIFKSNKKNSTDAKIFDELVEEIFNSEDNNDNLWLDSQYKNIIKGLNNKEEENYYANLIKEKEETHPFIYINEKENEEIILKDFCNLEKNALEDKIKYAENLIFNLESEKKDLNNKKVSLDTNINSNAENLKLKDKEINNQVMELNALKNSAINNNNNYNNHSETLLIMNSLISLVNNYYNNLENSIGDKAHDNNNNKDSEKFASTLIELIGQADKVKDYSLSIFLSEIANNHLKKIEKGSGIQNYSSLLEYKSEIKNKILEALEKIKKKHVEKQFEINKNTQGEILLREKGLENDRKFVELLNEEIIKYQNDLIIYKQRLEIIEESLSAFSINFIRLSDLKSDLIKICN